MSVFFLLAVSIFAIVLPSYAQADDCRVTLQTVLPLTFWKFHPLVTVRINGQPVRMIVDTGSQTTIMTPEAAAAMRLPQDRVHSSNVTGITGKIYSRNVILDELEIGSSIYAQMSVGVVPINVPASGQLPGPMVAGIIGADVLADYDLDYEPLRRILSLYHVDHCDELSPPWRGRYEILPAVLTPTRRMAIPLELDGYKLTAIFDTGAASVQLALASAPRAGVTKDMLVHDPLSGVYGIGSRTFQAHKHHFGQIRIGYEIFPKGINIEVVDFPPREADMLLGESFMFGRRFWVSYATHAIFVQKRVQRRQAEMVRTPRPLSDGM